MASRYEQSFFCSVCDSVRTGKFSLAPESFASIKNGLICEDCAKNIGMYCRKHKEVHVQSFLGGLHYCFACYKEKMDALTDDKLDDICDFALENAEKYGYLDYILLIKDVSLPIQLGTVVASITTIYALCVKTDFDDALIHICNFPLLAHFISGFPMPARQKYLY